MAQGTTTTGTTEGGTGTGDTSTGSTALYDWWLGELPSWFGIVADRSAGHRAVANAAAPRQAGKAGQSHGGDESSAASPRPVNQIVDSLAVTGELLNALYSGYLRAMTGGRADDSVAVFERWMQAQITAMRDRVAALGSQWPDASADGLGSVAGLGASLGKGGLAALSAPLAAAAAAFQPLARNADRAYGGLSDAIGLAPLRSLQEALAQMGRAALDHQKAQAAYLEAVSGALGRGGETVLARLAAMRESGESIGSLLDLTRLWAQSTDAAMHAALQSPQALEASASTIRATARWRQQQQRVVAVLSEALNVPTRAELDDAYREIQELKREVRRLRKSMPAQPADAAALPRPAIETADKPASRSAAKPRTKTAAKGATKTAAKTRAKTRAKTAGKIPGNAAAKTDRPGRAAGRN